MTGDTIALTALCVTLIGILIAFVRKAAVTETSHQHQLLALERSVDMLFRSLERLERTAMKLDKSLAVTNARASQGQFDESDTDRPPRE